MAVQQNSLKYFGGQQSGGDSSARQVVIERTDMTAAFTEDEYQRCLSAISLGYAVAINWNPGGLGQVVRQLQLVTKRNTGNLEFSYTRDDNTHTWTVSGSSPHTISETSYEFDDSSITPVYDTGTKIADVRLDGVDTELYIPSGDDCKVEIFNCTEPYWPNPTEMFDSYNDGKDVVIVRQSLSGVIYSVWRLENVVEDLGLVKNYTLEFQNEDGDTTATHKTKRVKFHSTDYETWTTTEKTFYYPERKTIAPNWNALDVSNYKKRTLVYRAGVLYRCKTNSPSGSWVDSEWEETDVSKEISGILEEQNMVLKHLKTDSVVSYELNGNLATATITLPTDKTLSTARLDNGGAKNTFISASVENVIKKAKISLGGAGKVLSRAQLSGMISIDVKIDSSESQSGTDVLISSILLKIGEWGEWEEKNIPIDFSSITTESWSSSYRDSKPVRLVINHSVTEFTLEDFNIQDDFVNQTLDIFIELGIKADKTTTSDGTGLID